MTKTRTIHIRGMFCEHCESRIRKALLSLPGVEEAEASFENESAVITCSGEMVSDTVLQKCIEDAGYEMVPEDINSLQSLSIIVILLAIWVIARHMGWARVFNLFPRIETSLSLGALFVTGLLTGVHCIAMCGGINLTQSVLSASAKARLFRSNLLYQAGRIISYTVIGAAAGGIGKVLALSGKGKGIIEIIAGCAIIIMAVNMLGGFKPLRRFRFTLSAKLYSGFSRRIKANSSFVIGLLNGLMPCGPLQSMQIYALSAGSALRGALSMLLFSLGTVLLMLGFGLISGRLNRKYTQVMLKVSALLIFVMGLNMVGNGFSLSGVSVSRVNSAKAVTAMQSDGLQILRTEIDYGSYPAVKIKADVPVRWTIIVPEEKLNGCNGEILIPALDVDLVLHAGENILEFTAEEPGVIPYSCWMGMIRSTIEAE